MATILPGAVIHRWQRARRGLSDDLPLRAGLLAGAAAVVLSLAFRGLAAGRYLGDPLPLALGVTGIFRGFAYFDWRSPLIHAVYAVALGASAAVILRLGQTGRSLAEDGARSARIAGTISVAVVGLLEVDAVAVALWYALGGFLSVALASYSGRLAARILTGLAPRP